MSLIRILRKHWGRVAIIMVATLLLLGVATYARAKWEVEHTRLNEARFVTSELDGELRVVQVTDFHNLPRAAQVDEVIHLVASANPHFIALTGDLIDTYNENLDRVEQLIEGLAGIGVPIYSVDGNHDHWAAEHTQLLDLLHRHGVTTLRDEHINVTGDWGSLTLVGVDDYFSGYGNIGKAVEAAPEDGFRFVLTHSPEILPELGSHGVDYAICGHTHGGQVRLPLIGALYQPGDHYLPRVSKGFYRNGDATLFIDSGVGITGPAYRLLNQSQVTLHRIGP